MKKLLSLLLCLTIVFSSMPIGVIAEDTQSEESSAFSLSEHQEESMEEETEESVEENQEESIEEEEPQEEVIEDTIQEEAEEKLPEENIQVNQNSENDKIEEENEQIELVQLVESQVIDNIKITVNGAFAEEGTLSIQKVESQELSENNIAESHSFDIKVLNSDNQEIQPIDKIHVSFEFESISENVDIEVYHEEEQLEAETKENVVTVESDGFSIYTVEFTYNDKEYVLEGDTYVKLSDILDFVGLAGEVESWEISNNELFTVLKGDEYGISYDIEYIDEIEYATPIDNPDGNILYMAALQMFDTEEWLDITIDGITYHIIVTDDAYVNGQSQNKITDNRVVQGGNETNFTATMPLATIFIDEDIVNMDAYKLLPPTIKTQEQYDVYVAEHGENPSWNVGDIDYDNPENTGKMVARLVYDTTQTGARTGMKVNTSPDAGDAYGQLYFDFADGDWDKGTTANNHVINTWNGPVVEYRFINAAERFNTETQQYERMDVIITYSNVNISMQYNFNMDNYSKLTKYDILDANKIQPKLFASSDLGGNANDRTGLKLDVNIQVVDKNDNRIPGSYYFPLVDADIGRSGAFGNLYKGTNTENNYYSEQFVLLDNYGQPTSAGEWEQKIWIPGGDYDKTKAASQTSNMPYLSNIDSINGNLRIKPGASYSSIPANGYEHPVTGNTGRDEDFYTGFATLANNTDGGVKFRYWGNSAYRATPSGSGTVTSYVLAGTQRINHKLDASSDEGGTIYTTTTGNSDGSLSGGELMGNNLVNSPHQISTATGQHTTYTMTPKGGYRIKSVYVKSGDIDVLEQVEGGNGATYNVPISDLTSKGHGIYTYTFTDIQEDSSIHVEWEKTELSVTKNITPADPNETHKFNFQIRLWDTSTEDSIWRVRARKYNGTLIRDYGIEDGTPYYMTYSESHNEEGEIERYTEVPASEITDETNPSENGWYESVRYLAQAATQNLYMTRYFLTEDTEPYVEIDDITGLVNSRKTYYTREVVEGNIERYYQHILGYNEETNTWTSYDVRSDVDNSVVADLGLTNIDETLSDNYRFVEEEGKVYLKSSFDTESQTYTKYLMWVSDDQITRDVLVVGNEELYPEGTPFEAMGVYNDYIYLWKDDEREWLPYNKIIRSEHYMYIYLQLCFPSASHNKYKYERDTNNPVHYDFVSNPDGFALQDGYTKLTGETGMYIINLPAGQSPDLSAFEGTDWDLLVSRVGAIQDDFDMDAEFIAKGATPAAGANTYTFSLAPGETIDFEGCVPMGWNYEIIETGLEGTIWQEVSHTTNANISDFDGEEAVEFVNQKRLYDLDITKETVNDAPGTFEFKVKVWHESAEEFKPTTLDESGAGGNWYENDLPVNLIEDVFSWGSSETISGEFNKPVNLTVRPHPYGIEKFIPEPCAVKLFKVAEINDNGTIATISPFNPPNGDSTFANIISALEPTQIKYMSSTNDAVFLDVEPGFYLVEFNENWVSSAWILPQQDWDSGEIVTDSILDCGAVYQIIQPIITEIPMDLSEQFGEPDSDGYYHFTLSEGSGIKIEDILYGYHYEVIEVPQEGWTLESSENTTGMMSKDTTAKFTNKKDISLTVKKETDADTDEEFEFEIVFPSNNSTYIYAWSYIEPMQYALLQEDALSYSYQSAIMGINLYIWNKSGWPPDNWAYEKVKIPGITATAYQYGTGDEIEIIDADSFWLNDWTQIELYDDSNNLLRTHNRDDLQFNSLDSGEQFICTESNGASINSVNFIKNNESGTLDLTEQDDVYVGTFKLKKDEEIKFTDIPYSIEYEIYEIDQFGNRVAIGDIFNTKWELKSKTNDSGTLTENTTSVFTNKMKKGSINVKKETKGDEAGEFKFKVKVWKDVVGYDYNNLTLVTEMYEEPSDDFYNWGVGSYRECIDEEAGELINHDIYWNGTCVSGLELATCSSSGAWDYMGYEYNTHPFTQEYLHGDFELIPFLKTFVYYIDENNIEHNTETYNHKDTGEKITIDGIEYPLIVSGYGHGAEHNYQLFIPKLITENISLDLSEQLGEIGDDRYYEFTLKNGENLKIEDIPFGHKYEVYEETPDGWELVSIDELTPRDKAEGTIESETPYEHTFLNAKKKTLTFGKEVTGNMGDKTKEFEFEVKVHGWKLLFADEVGQYLAANSYFGGTAGILFKYPELNQPPFEAYFDKFESGNLRDLKEYVGTHTYCRFDTGLEYDSPGGYEGNSLNNGDAYWQEISGRGVGNIGESHYSIDYPQPIEGIENTKQGEVYSPDWIDLEEYGGKYIGNGVFKFNLKHGETVTIPDLPYGYSYEIIEKDYSEEGYEQKVDGAAGRRVSGTLTEDKEHKFENRLQVSVPTKISLYNNYMYIIILLISIMGLSTIIIRRKLKK